MEINLPSSKQLILFDGVCNLCNDSVQYVIQRDRKNSFMFAPLQGETGQALMKAYAIDPAQTDSVLLYTPGEGIKYKSSAAIKIASKLGFPTNFLRLFWIVPAFIRNAVYDYIAKNRYKWYGQKSECMIPTPDLKAKFLP